MNVYVFSCNSMYSVYYAAFLSPLVDDYYEEVFRGALFTFMIGLVLK